MNTHSSTDFYRQFEDRFRTSRGNIKQRLQVYQPLLAFLQSSRDAFPDGKLRALDLGCGRGEWLELLLEAGFDAEGVDLNAGMLGACKELGLPAVEGDALDQLRRIPDNSLALVSAFHMAEHIPFETLLSLIEQALRVLVPGGLLLMETPNPENLSVGTSSFYLDPTHTKPIPQALLSFVTEHKGFAAQQVLRVNELYTPHPDDPVLLRDMLFNVSPDYAVVAIKSTSPDTLTAFQSVLPRTNGVALDQVAYQYDHRIAKHLQSLEHRITQANHYAHRLHLCLVHAQSLNETLEQRIRELERTRQTVQPRGVVSLIKRIPRLITRLSRSIREHGATGLWLPLEQYLNANPRRRNAAMRRLRSWNLTAVSAALFNESNIRTRIAKHYKPAPVKTLPPSAQAIDDVVLFELYTHIEE